jgi:hypothetical protein
MLPIIYDVDQWCRVGRGKELQFFATDSEVQEWLLRCLPSANRPYSLVGEDLIPFDKRHYAPKPFRFELSEFPQCVYRSTGDTRFNFWIHSDRLTPGLRLDQRASPGAICSLNGLLLLQHGSCLDGRRDASRIAIVDRVQHAITGETRHYYDYLVVFKHLRKIIRRALIYSSMQTFADGHIEEDTSLQLMTDGAVRSHHAGFRFTNEPGRRIRPDNS